MAAPATTVWLSHDGTNWTEVTSAAAAGNGGGQTWRRGRSKVLGEWPPGNATFTFRNQLRAVDPTNGDATFTPRARDYIRVRVAGVTHWQGRVLSMTATYGPGGGTTLQSTLTVNAVDDLAAFATHTVTTAYAGGLISARIQSHLGGNVGYPGTYDVETSVMSVSGGVTGGAASTDGANAMTLLQAAMLVEGGRSSLFMSKTGVLTFRNRHQRPSTVVALGGTTGIGFVDIVVNVTDDEWTNRYSMAAQGYTSGSTTSGTSLTTGTGSKTFTIAAETSPLEVGQTIVLDSAGSSASMTGTITSFVGLSITANITATTGSGTHTDWNVNWSPSTTAQVASDAQSVERFDTTRTRTITAPWPGTVTALREAYIRAAGDGFPALRIEHVTVELGNLSGANQTSILGLEIGDAVTVTLDTGTGDPRYLTQTRMIDGIAHTVPGNGSHRVTFTLGPEATVDFTAVVKQNGSTVASTTRDATYVDRDGWVDAHLYLDITAAGTVATELKVTPTGLPAPYDTYTGEGCGTFWYVDTGTVHYVGAVDWDGTDLRFLAHLETDLLGVDPSFAAANGDSVRVAVSYRRALT